MQRRAARRAALALFASRAGAASTLPELALVHGWVDHPPAGSKQLLLIRHAEGWHNKDARELPNYFVDGLGHTERYRDARLTPQGESEAEALRQTLLARSLARPELVAVSPLTRALETATIAFGNGTGAPRYVATSLARERIWDHTCDWRRPRHVLEREFPHCSFGELAEGDHDEMWAAKEDDDGGVRDARTWNSSAVAARARALLRWLHAREESTAAVVSHWVFLSHLTRPHGDAALAAPFNNAEVRLATLLPRTSAADEPAHGDEV
jgi:broad specificity phosphatase PhoE